MKIIDAHTHIDYIAPDVDGAVCCACTESDWQKIIYLMKNDKRVYGAFGVHPWFIDSVQDGFDNRLEKLLLSNSNYMVGEIGLDKYKPDMEKQIEVFMKQFDIAINLKRSVSLHCVGAWDRILHILKQYKQIYLPKIVVHNFNENDAILKQLLKYENIFFSLIKNSVYDRNNRIEQIQLNIILIETDGKPEFSLRDVLMKLVQIKKDKTVPEIIYTNTIGVLKYGQIT